MNEFKVIGSTAIMYVNYKGAVLEVLIDTDCLPKVQAYGTWYGNKIGNHVYIKCKFMYKTYQLHRVILDDPDGIVDHRDGNTLDNRRSNLRATNNSKNVLNSTKITGVHWREDRQKWVVQKKYEGKMHNLGQYSSYTEAAIQSIAFRNQHLRDYYRKSIQV